MHTCLQGCGLTPLQLADPQHEIEPQQELRMVTNLTQALPHIPTSACKPVCAISSPLWHLGLCHAQQPQIDFADATLINAPSSTKNKGGKHDPQMHQIKKGKQYYFGMKAQ